MSDPNDNPYAPVKIPRLIWYVLALAALVAFIDLLRFLLGGEWPSVLGLYACMTLLFSPGYFLFWGLNRLVLYLWRKRWL